MKYLSIDIETTGLEPENNQILSIGAILEDSENLLPFDKIPKFHVAITREHVTGSLFALNMNKDLIETIVHYQTAKDQDEKNDLVQMTGMQFLSEESVVEAFYEWMFIHGAFEFDTQKIMSGHVKRSLITDKMVPCLSGKMEKANITCAGKNFGTFDKLFLEKLPRWKQAIKIRQRIIDPAVLFIDWKNDKSLPGLLDCKKRAGIDGIVTHNAIEDAWDVILLLRKTYNK